MGFYCGNANTQEVRQEFICDGKSQTNRAVFLSYFQNVIQVRHILKNMLKS
ncbi:MAG: hypothetical protein ACI9UT_003145 [Flavobacteriales bacterium]|jgi:hypothetical protein